MDLGFLMRLSKDHIDRKEHHGNVPVEYGVRMRKIFLNPKAQLEG